MIASMQHLIGETKGMVIWDDRLLLIYYIKLHFPNSVAFVHNPVYRLRYFHQSVLQNSRQLAFHLLTYLFTSCLINTLVYLAMPENK